MLRVNIALLAQHLLQEVTKLVTVQTCAQLEKLDRQDFVHLVLQASTNLSQEVHSAHCALPTPQVQLGPIFVIATKDTLVQKAALVECAEREATRIQQVLNRALFVALENIQASTEQLLL